MVPGPRVVVTFPGFGDGPDPAASILRDAGATISLAPKTGPRDTGEVISIMQGAAGAVVSTDPFDRRVLERLVDLRVIARVGVGSDSIDVATATELGVLVATTPGANTTIVAEHTLALMLATVRRIVEHDAGVRAGRWERTGPMMAGQLAGRTVGIVGYGAIGRSVAARLAGFDVEIVAHDPFVQDADVPLLPLDVLLERSDVVTLHLPLDAATHGLIGAQQLARLPEGAVVISTARGGILDEEALVDALRSGRLAGAGLDVFADEPPAGSPLLELRNVVSTPHVAGISHASVAEMTRRACAAVASALRGDVPADAINPEAIERRR